LLEYTHNTTGKAGNISKLMEKHHDAIGMIEILITTAVLEITAGLLI